MTPLGKIMGYELLFLATLVCLPFVVMRPAIALSVGAGSLALAFILFRRKKG